MPQIVGRESELAAIGRLLEAARSSPRALVLVGEPGAGKTTLWRAGVEQALAAGFRVLRSQPAPEESAWGFGALAELLDGAPPEALEALPWPQRQALDVALMRRDVAGPPPDQGTVAMALASLLRGLAAEAPLLIACDDVQWLDPPSAAVLAFGLRRTRVPMGLLATRRDAAAPSVERDLGRGWPAGSVEQLRVGPLTLGALHRLFVERLGASFPHLTLVRIFEVSQGNAFYALELARELKRVRATLAPGAPLPVPTTLGELLTGRLARLPAATRAALLAVAAAGDPAMALLHRALGSDPAAALEPARRAGIIETTTDTVRFSHPLLAAAVLDDASAEDRRQAHRRLASASADLESRARHLGLAAGGADEATAAEIARAADRARARGATLAAVELLTLACRLTPPGPELHETRLERRLALGQLTLEAGETETARDELAALMVDAGPGSIRARAALDAARLAQDREGFRAATELCESVLPDVADDPRLAARVHAMASRFADFDAARKACHAAAAAEALARVAEPDPELEILTLAARIEAEGALAHEIPERLVLRVAQLEATTDPGRHAFVGSSVMAFVLAGAAEYERARPWLEGMLPWTRDHLPSRYPRRLGHLVRVELGAGHWDLAERLLDEQQEWAEQLEQPVVSAWSLVLRTALEAYRGDERAARQAAETALVGISTTESEHLVAEAYASLGLLELAAGRHEAALGYLRRVDAIRAALGARDPAFQLYRGDLVEALVGTGRLDEALTVLESFEHDAELAGRAWGLTVSARARALLEAARGDLPSATAAAEAALRHQDRLPMPLERARTLLVLGQVQRRRKAKLVARDRLEEARVAFVLLGARGWAVRAEAELERVGLLRRTPGALTPTEETIVGLVAEGLTNRQIAEQAFLAEKTVEGNLSRIYSKLGVRSRAELAVWRARRESRPHGDETAP